LQWGLYEAELDPAAGLSRPVLVVSGEEFNQAMPGVTVLPLTTSRRALYPSEVLLPAEQGRLPKDAIVMAHQARMISKARLRRLLGRLEDDGLRAQVRAALGEHFDL
jgi:mRNA interferase MazF